MAGFNASEAVPRLDFDLSPHGPTGVIPEPSVAQIDALTAALRAAFNVDDSDTATDAELLVKIGALSDEEQQQRLDGIKDAILDILAPVIAREGYDALPFRIQRAFQGWLLGSLLAPEGQRPATTT